MFVGSWLSGYFIVATNAFMQYPTGYTLGADGNLKLADFWGFVLSRWALTEYAHNMLSSRGHSIICGLGGGSLLSSARPAHRSIETIYVKLGLAYGTFHSEVKGLGAFPPDTWPDNIELLYYSFHIMAGLGTIMIALMALAAILNWAGRLARSRRLLWVLMLAFPLPYIAVTAGWLTAELGRQPWVVYGLQRTAEPPAAPPTRKAAPQAP